MSTTCQNSQPCAGRAELRARQRDDDAIVTAAQVGILSWTAAMLGHTFYSRSGVPWAWAALHFAGLVPMTVLGFKHQLYGFVPPVSGTTTLSLRSLPLHLEIRHPVIEHHRHADCVLKRYADVTLHASSPPDESS